LARIIRVKREATTSLTQGEPAKKVSFRISHPNSCSLKYDELDLKLRDMLIESGIEPQEPHTVAVDDNVTAPTNAP
jgi:hypothetical protein